MTAAARRPLLVVLSSPSGGGKTTIARELLRRRNDVQYSVSATTRRPRPGERDGRDYYFLSREEFARRREAGALLEWAEYGGEWYGTPAAEVDRILGTGRHVLLDIEVKGAQQLRERRQDVVSIFIIPPSAAVLIERLGGRGGAEPAELRRRLEVAVEELGQATGYDYLVVNDEREAAVAAVSAIIDAEVLRIARDGQVQARLDRLARDIARELERYRH